MKMGNLKIGTRLRIGYLVVILFTLAIGGVALFQINVLTDLVSEMYDHPLTVGYAMRDIRSEIDEMHDQVQKLLFAENSAELDEVEKTIDEASIRVLDKFVLVAERFLGDKNDVLIAQKAFTNWAENLHQEFETVRTEGKQKLDAAFYRNHLERTDQLHEKLTVMIDFALNKAQSFRDMAREREAQTRTTMAWLLGATLFLSLVIAWVITNSISPSLKRMVQRMMEIAKGDLRRNMEIYQKDEIGALAESFREMQSGLRNKAEVALAIAGGDLDRTVSVNGDDDLLGNAINQMTAALRKSRRLSDLQDWVKTGKNELSRIIVGQGDLKVLSTDLLGFYAGYINAQIGALYAMSDEDTLTLQGRYAAGSGDELKMSIAPGEGLVGQAALEKKMLTLTDLPKDYFCIRSSLGGTPARHLLAIPILFENVVKGVIELGSIEPFSDAALDFLHDTAGSVATAVHTVQNQLKLKEYLTQSREQAEQLQVQEEELRAANEELEEQTRSLKNSEEQLKQQQEELKTINEELEEKNQSLEEQQKQIGQKNQALENAGRELAVTSRYKSEFLANMSHELRTPLNSLLLLSRDLMENTQGNLTPDQVEAADIIHRGGTELLQLINEVLDLSKIEAGRMALKLGNVPLKDLAGSIEQSFSHVAVRKGLRFRVEVGENLPPGIRTDGQRLRQILKNLISNALKFTEQGEVVVAIECPSYEENPMGGGINAERWLAIRVRDTGIGVPGDRQKRIFEAFQQADSSTARKYGGTGLGLSISRELGKTSRWRDSAHERSRRGIDFHAHPPPGSISQGHNIKRID